MEVRKSSRLIIINDDGQLLLFRYHDEHQEPFWATVGGELKLGETYLDAAKRELYEETGLDIEIGVLLRERDEVYAVARSEPARWMEKYFLVKCPKDTNVYAADWTDEEKSTIQGWQWWSKEEMVELGANNFKPNWLPELLGSIVAKNA